MKQVREMPEYKEIDDAIAALNIEYSADFVPQSQSREPGTERINWRIKFGSLEVPYSQGIGYLPSYVQASRRTIYLDDAIKTACEKGFWDQNRKKHSKSYNLTKLPPPNVRDVLYCLLLDGEVIEHDSFESWAGDFGYDTDSIKALAIYNECLTTGLKLRSMLGNEKLSALHELYQDY